MRKLLLVTLLAFAAAAVAQERDGREAQSQPAAPSSPQAIVAGLGEDYAPAVETLPYGRIDWTSGHLVVQGQGRVRGSGGKALAAARRAAHLAAARNAILLMQGLRVDAQGGFADVEEGKVSVEGVLRDFEESAMEYDPNAGTVTVTLRAPLYGSGGVARTCRNVKPPQGVQWETPATDQAEAEDDEQAEVVIVEAEGERFSPMMYPAIVSPDGKRVFDSGDVEPRQLRRRAMAIYAAKAKAGAARDETLHRAEAARGKLRPLVLKAAVKDKSGTLVLEEQSAAKLRAHGRARRLMQSGKLVIIVQEKQEKKD